MKSIEEAAHRHAFEDGITEILLGALLAAGAMMGVRRAGILILAGAVALKWVIPRLRDRISTPRVGSADLPHQAFGSMKGIVAYVILAAGAALAAARLAAFGSGASFGGYRWIPLFAGLALSGGFLSVAGKTGLKRFYLYFAATIGGGLLFALTMSSGARQEAYEALRNLLWGLSALLLAMGTVALIGFIHRHPVFTGDATGSGPHE